MRLRKKIAVICVVVFGSAVVAAGGSYLYLSSNARQIFNSQASSLTQRRVEARVVKAEFPTRLVVEGLAVEGGLSCVRLSASIDIFSLFSRQIQIHTLVLDQPVVVWSPSLTVIDSQPSAASSSNPGKHPVTTPRTVILAELIVRDGVLKFIGGGVAGDGRVYEVDRIQLRAKDVPLTNTPARTEFFVTGSLAKLNAPFVGHFLKASGWVNWFARDMDAVAQAMDDDGRVGLDAKLSARQNDMAVSGRVRFTGEQGPQASGQKAGLVENVVLSALMATQTEIDAGFSFKTKMDRFEMGTVGLTGQITTGLNSNATSGNIVAGLKAAGQELLKASEDTGISK